MKDSRDTRLKEGTGYTCLDVILFVTMKDSRDTRLKV